MTDETKRERNPLNEALPQVFNREGIVKKNPRAPRATGRDFSKIMAKTLFIRNQLSTVELPSKIRIQIPAGSLTLTRELTELLAVMGHDDSEQPDLIAALMLNGWNVTTTVGGA